VSKSIVLGITGASGSIYSRRLIYHLQKLNIKVELIITENGRKVINFENEKWILEQGLTIHSIDNMFAGPASGTSSMESLVILPSSMGTIGNIAAGTSNNLLVRAADVCLKERKKLVIVPREMPFNLIHLENMKTLIQSGAHILSASPFFYNHPKNIEELVDTVIAKILDLLNINHSILPKWGD